MGDRGRKVWQGARVAVNPLPSWYRNVSFTNTILSSFSLIISEEQTLQVHLNVIWNSFSQGNYQTHTHISNQEGSSESHLVHPQCLGRFYDPSSGIKNVPEEAAMTISVFFNQLCGACENTDFCPKVKCNDFK